MTPLMLEPFTALVAECSMGQVFGAAMLAEQSRLLFFGFVSAARAEFGVWRQIFAAVAALADYDKLMAAVRTKPGLGGYGASAVRAGGFGLLSGS